MAVLEDYEHTLLQSLFDYNRIPLWLFTSDKKCIQHFNALDKKVLSELMTHLIQLLEMHQDEPLLLLHSDHEMYYLITFERKHQTYHCLGGPVLMSNANDQSSRFAFAFQKNIPHQALLQLIHQLPTLSWTAFVACFKTMALILNPHINLNDEFPTRPLIHQEDSFVYTFAKDIAENRYASMTHSSYKEEKIVLECVREGDVQRLEATYRAMPEIVYGNMSTHPLKQLFYGCIANTTLVTRYAIEGGLDDETAFTLSDLYIRQMELCRTTAELSRLNEQMGLDFTQQVHDIRAQKNRQYSQAIQVCLDYIERHFHEKPTLQVLSEVVHLTPKYLSFLFKKETGQSLHAYINTKRIEEAKKLLIYSDYEYSEISQLLGFHSQSHFINVFKKAVGFTPKNYRSQQT